MKKRPAYVAQRAMLGKAKLKLSELYKMRSRYVGSSAPIDKHILKAIERSILIQEKRASRAGKRLGPVWR